MGPQHRVQSIQFRYTRILSVDLTLKQIERNGIKAEVDVDVDVDIRDEEKCMRENNFGQG